MGAWMTEQAGIGKTASEAFRNAVADAAAENGHQQGYSGAINSGGGSFSLVALPARMTYAKFQSLLEGANDFAYDDLAETIRWERENVAAKRRGAKGRLAKAERERKAWLRKKDAFYAKVEKAGFDRHGFDRLVEAYNDKWGGYLAVELRGAEKKRYAGYRTPKRGEKVFLFFGYAPS